MNTIPSQDIKRCGIGVVDDALEKGPVHVVRNNRPQYVIMTQDAYDSMLGDLAEARLAASEADLKEGRIKKGSAKGLMKELRKG